MERLAGIDDVVDRAEPALRAADPCLDRRFQDVDVRICLCGRTVDDGIIDRLTAFLGMFPFAACGGKIVAERLCVRAQTGHGRDCLLVAGLHVVPIVPRSDLIRREHFVIVGVIVGVIGGVGICRTCLCGLRFFLRLCQRKRDAGAVVFRYHDADRIADGGLDLARTIQDAADDAITKLHDDIALIQIDDPTVISLPDLAIQDDFVHSLSLRYCPFIIYIRMLRVHVVYGQNEVQPIAPSGMGAACGMSPS